MQVKFYIDNKGRIFTSGRGKARPVRTYPVELSRTGNRINVRLQPAVSETALLSLMNHTRSMKYFDFMLTSDLEGLASKRDASVEPFCLDLDLACLKQKKCSRSKALSACGTKPIMTSMCCPLIC